MKIIKFVVEVIIFIVACIGRNVYDVVEPLVLNDAYMNQLKDTTTSYAIINLYPYLKYGYYSIMVFILVMIIIDLIDLAKGFVKGE